MKVVNKSGLFKTNVKKDIKSMAAVCTSHTRPALGSYFLPYYPCTGSSLPLRTTKSGQVFSGSPWADPILKYFQQFSVQALP